eukprot:gene7181-7947_t
MLSQDQLLDIATEAFYTHCTDLWMQVLRAGFVGSPEACAAAAQADCLTGLTHLHETMHVQWDARTCAGAAKGHSLQCLKYAHENGCPWDETTCASAAQSGALECLRYAHENHCPWDATQIEETESHMQRNNTTPLNPQQQQY